MLISVDMATATNWLIQRGLREVENQPEKEAPSKCLPTKKTTEKSKDSPTS